MDILPVDEFAAITATEPIKKAKKEEKQKAEKKRGAKRGPKPKIVEAVQTDL